MPDTLCEWGMAGLLALHERAAALVIVDVLSFSTAVDIAVARGAIVHPFPFSDQRAAQQEAAHLGATLAYPRNAAGGQYSLSPASLATIPRGTRLLLPSPNGSRLSVAAAGTRRRIPVLAGCLRNARAVAAAARRLAGTGAVGVIPAGELWPDGGLRPAIEDLLGAGAIIEHLGGEASPEAEVARDAWRAAGYRLGRMIRLCTSGQELVSRGYSGDVDLALEEDASATAPVLRDGAYRAA
ncbi:2-phosphosulfolactate phosphatase [Roseomonas mucosa]|uniref:Probable 2-phosphosulfolactate phosphatase n=1 Tax=Roseomonas mucosa TaxID=207340 RepID=A0A4Y1MY32_9PROT|nr:2-phosphosulfolactate phosphatase [Roseomonas mucosa]AWV22912.1 2-phosphosulfolactate phosphatase [Roseomonas mucosa]MDT8274731.1 2-phosphosulfolactate phosphatase [Roseomonas mucosa]MDT8354042.1 2-phosphosulfolactate phosphatase [Roseomonas mucosa]